VNSEPLPPSLRELEDQLARRPCPEPAVDFRALVLGALADSRARPLPERAGRCWGLVWRAAAAVVLALNLGMSAANGVRFQRLTPPRAEGPRVPVTFDGDDRFQRLAASALANLTPAPDAGALGRNLFSSEEGRGWATH
jgi:hypothetical protein